MSDEKFVGAKSGAHTSATEPIKAIPDRHPWRWVSAGAVLVLVAMLVHSLFFSDIVRNGQVQPRYQWGVVGHYMTWPTVISGLEVTLFVTAVAMVIGIVLGVVAAVCRLSVNPVLSTVSWVYIWFFRGTPVYVQLLFWYAIAYLYPTFSLGIPFGPTFVTFSSNAVVTAIVAGIVGLGLNEGAYMAEIVRAGILSVDEGQSEAAQSIGMTRIQTLRRIVLPQAMRVIIPPVGNETISMLKTSSLVSAITVAELTFSVQAIYAVNYETVPLLMVASLWYLAVTSVLTIGQYYVERYYARGAVRELPPTPLQRLRARISGRSSAAAASNALAAEELIIFGQQNKD